MALIKTSGLPSRKPEGSAAPASASPPATGFAAQEQSRSVTRSRARRAKAVEQISVASEELAAGVAEASAAAEQLLRGLLQMASAAEEAAGAAQESQGAITNLGSSFAEARRQADRSSRLTTALEAFLRDAATQIEAFIAFVKDRSARQLRSVEVVKALERQTISIGAITHAVGDISDQTNLLALNAAIEATRAGEHGRSFAVLAEEVRAYADSSEASAGEVQALAEAIGTEVRGIATRIRSAAETAETEARNGTAMIATLDAIRTDMRIVEVGAQAILAASLEADVAAREAQSGAAQIATAAEEQSAATAEAQGAVREQGEALEQSRQTAEALATMIEAAQGGAEGGFAAEQVASAAERLSATVQELSGAAGQIQTALGQISGGAQAQAAATQQASAAMREIERTAKATGSHATETAERLTGLTARFDTVRSGFGALYRSLEEAQQEAEVITGLVVALEAQRRGIEKIVDNIALVAVQTNMLAVSGSVEAARAGESGRGFAIVSVDIRQLARDAAGNAERMKDAVYDIRDHMQAVQRDLEGFTLASHTEMGRGRLVTERLDLAAIDLTALHEAAMEIRSGSDAILLSVSQVTAGTQQVADAAEEASRATAEASVAARQQAKGIEELAAAIEEIATLADELQPAEA